VKPVEDIPYFHKAGFPPSEIGACSPYNTKNGGFVKTLFLLILGSTLSEAKLSGHKTGESRRVGRSIFCAIFLTLRRIDKIGAIDRMRVSGSEDSEW
jgi:hypothetical protein